MSDSIVSAFPAYDFECLSPFSTEPAVDGHLDFDNDSQSMFVEVQRPDGPRRVLADFNPAAPFKPITCSGVPGVKCPTCAAKGINSYVIRGKICPNCNTPCM